MLARLKMGCKKYLALLSGSHFKQVFANVLYPFLSES